MANCDNYCENLALWSCAECNESFCTECDRALHKPPPMRDHHRSKNEEQTGQTGQAGQAGQTDEPHTGQTQPTEAASKVLSALRRESALRAAASQASQQQFDQQLSFQTLQSRVADLFASAIQPFLSKAPGGTGDSSVRLSKPLGTEAELKKWKTQVKLDRAKQLSNVVRVALPSQAQKKEMKEEKKEYPFDGGMLYPGAWDQMSEDHKKLKETEWEGLSEETRKRKWEYPFHGAIIYLGEWDEMSGDEKKKKEKEWEELSKGKKKKTWNKKLTKAKKQGAWAPPISSSSTKAQDSGSLGMQLVSVFSFVAFLSSSLTHFLYFLPPCFPP